MSFFKNKVNFKFANGDLLRDKITGFEAIVTGRANYLTGCNQYALTAKSKDNAEAVSIWFDEGRLETVKEKVFTETDVKADKNGCDIKKPNKF